MARRCCCFCLAWGMSDLISAVDKQDLRLVQLALTDDVNINQQNANGDTALHVAISGGAEFEILKLLLSKGSSVNIKNNAGYTPLQMIDPESHETFLNLFRLEKYINYAVGVGNTVMHLMMMTTQDDPMVWERILAEFSNLHIDFNAQNVIGHTPLHTAASRLTGVTDLAFILSNFNNLNPLITDKRGDTFLHVFVLNAIDNEWHTTFLDDLLEGKFQVCSERTLKKLLRTKNLTNHSPLHLAINENDIMSVDLLEKFIKAGSQIETENDFGENILHGLSRHFPEDVELIECALKHAAISKGDIMNGHNGFDESPIFFSYDINVLQIMLESGANLNIMNKVGKTPLMCRILDSTVNIEVIELFLSKGADVNSRDIHGNTALHYAAWNNIDPDVILLLKRFGANTVPDKLGQVPCLVAEKRGHMALIKYLCVCDTEGTHYTNTVTFAKTTTDFQELIKQKRDLRQYPPIQERIQQFQPSSISDVLCYPYLGSVMLQEDAIEVKSAVFEIIQRICAELGQRDQLLSNTMIQSGSVGENTKVGLPDEFDFVCILDLFSSVCEINEAGSTNDPGYAYVKLKPEYLNNDLYRHLFDETSFLDTEVLRERFLRVLTDIIQNADFCRHKNVIMDVGLFKESRVVPNCQLFLRWSGAEYKDILVNVDLVPAIRIRGWWPKNANLDTLVGDANRVREDGALVLLQTVFDEDYEEVTKLRVSALTAEKAQMNNLPQVARDVYMLTKILCDERVCPSVSITSDLPGSFLKTNITSYMLKNCLFFVFRDENKTFIYSDTCNSSETLHGLVCKVFREFTESITEEKLPSFVFPWQNIFTFQDPDCDLFPGQNHMKCSCRAVYVKLILTILGEVQSFSDIDVKTLIDEQQ